MLFGLSDVLGSISLSLIVLDTEARESRKLFFIFFILVLTDYTTSV